MFTTILLPFNGQITYNGRIFFFTKFNMPGGASEKNIRKIEEHKTCRCFDF